MSTLKRTIAKKTAPKKAATPSLSRAAPAVSSAKKAVAARVRKQTVPRAGAATAANIKVAKSIGAKSLADAKKPSLTSRTRPQAVEVAPESAGFHWKRQTAQLTDKEFSELSELKQRIGRLGTRLKRGEILRVGLRLMAELTDGQLLAHLERTALPRRG